MTTLATLTLITAGTAVAAQTRTTQLQHSQHVVKFFETHSWLRAPRHEQCADIPWQNQCRIARKVYQRHLDRIRLIERTIPNTTNWTRAMRYAQRVFPGTYGWLEAISGRECRACYTTSSFICNYQGSGACGPMQFMSGTFYGYADDAREYVRQHGFIVDENVWRWDNKLGQALTAAYMRFTGRDGCHWCL